MLAVSLCLAGCGGTDAKLAPLAQDAKILAFGDSLTYGSGASTNESYPSVLQDLTGREVVNAGVPGEITAEGLRRLPALLDEHQPSLLILCHGGNDFLRGLGEQQASENIRAMIGQAKARGIGVVLIAVPKFGLWLSPPDFYARIAEEFAVPYDAETLSQIIRNSSLKSDEVHPNGQGYRLIATAIASRLKEAGAIPTL
jgi:acyl-CoA thioesterase-1